MGSRANYRLKLDRPYTKSLRWEGHASPHPQSERFIHCHNKLIIVDERLGEFPELVGQRHSRDREACLLMELRC